MLERTESATRQGHMKLILDSDKCQGHGRCYALAPELMDSDDYGDAVLIGDGTVPEGMEEQARLIVDNCPEFAISLEE